MNAQDAARIAKKLAEIQYELRDDLLDSLAYHEDLKRALDPRTFSPEFDEIRDKYLDKLNILQNIINELANFSLCHTKKITRVVSISARSHQELTKRANQKLTALEGCRIVDVKFLKDEGSESQEWVAFITYMPNPLRPRQEKQTSNA